VFGDRTSFFNVCVKEIEKAGTIVEEFAKYLSPGVLEEEEELNHDTPDDTEDKIMVILDIFKDLSRLELTRYVKIFNNLMLGIANAKLDQDFNKLYKNLKFPKQEGRIVKSFTRPGATSTTGVGNYVSVSCKVFNLKDFTDEFKTTLLSLFNIDGAYENEEEVEEGMTQSQDYPQHKQSRSENTLRICLCCRFKTRDQTEYKIHQELHPKCPQCGLTFGNDDTLRIHHLKFHAKVTCDKCSKVILESDMKKHEESHKMDKNFKSGISIGKVKAKRKQSEDEPKRGKTAWNIFRIENRAAIQEKNPGANYTEVMKLLGAEWAKTDKTMWEKRAREEEVMSKSVKVTLRRNGDGWSAGTTVGPDEQGGAGPSLDFECVLCDQKFESKNIVKARMKIHVHPPLEQEHAQNILQFEEGLTDNELTVQTVQTGEDEPDAQIEAEKAKTSYHHFEGQVIS
jgi:hypothetical protein